MRCNLAVLMLPAAFLACADDNAHEPRKTVPVAVSGQTDLGVVTAQSGFLAGRGPTIVVDLHSQPVTGADTVFACYAVLPADTVIGEAECEEAPERRVPLTAGNAVQECSGSPTFGEPVPVSTYPELKDCASWKLKAQKFEPDLRIYLKPAAL